MYGSFSKFSSFGSFHQFLGFWCELRCFCMYISFNHKSLVQDIKNVCIHIRATEMLQCLFCTDFYSFFHNSHISHCLLCVSGSHPMCHDNRALSSELWQIWRCTRVLNTSCICNFNEIEIENKLYQNEIYFIQFFFSFPSFSFSAFLFTKKHFIKIARNIMWFVCVYVCTLTLTSTSTSKCVIL